MIAILRGTTAFVRWLLSGEHLPAPPADTLGASSRRGGFTAWFFAGDELAEASCGPPAARRRRELPIANCQSPIEDQPRCAGVGDLQSAFGNWHLAIHQKRAPRVGFLRWLLSPDVCQRFEEPPRRQSEGFWRWVLSSETCPCVEEPPRPRPKGFWHWVVSPGRL